MSALDLPFLWYQDMRVNVGMYANDDGGGAAPPGVTLSDSDGNWLFNTTLIPKIVNHHITHSAPSDIEEVIFEYPTGGLDIQSKRGPWTSNGGIWLCWAFLSSTSFWLLNDANYTGFQGGAVHAAVLVEF